MISDILFYFFLQLFCLVLMNVIYNLIFSNLSAKSHHNYDHCVEIPLSRLVTNYYWV